ncbi:MAG: hypothetical protein DRJ11_08405 [Candidatus Aminicenantes bacterium]|nr:MAG: hypothetical protein DRJ11_08405 [Candidatus Aminicenantes bacterium]
MSNNLRYTANQISKNMQAVFFLNSDISPKARQEIEKKLAASATVKKFHYVSPEEAAARFKDKFPELSRVVDSLGFNPFPPSIEVTFSKKSLSSAQVEKLLSTIQSIPGVEEVQYNLEWVDRVQAFGRLITAIGFFLGGILILASFFIISNVIKLNVLSRKDEIDILRLVGASNFFIRVPFVLEGMTLGLIGGLASLLLLFLTIQLLPLYVGTSLGALTELIRFRYLTSSQSLLLVASGIFIGFLGSLSSVSRLLREE